MALQHAITVADIIEWIINGAVTVVFTVLVLIALRSLLNGKNGNGKGS